MARRLELWCRVVAAIGAAAAVIAVPPARADGDPASDVLYGTSLFPSYDSGISPQGVDALVGTIADAKKAGYEIRVAIIAKPDDLGAVTSLWAKPRQYARFLGTELGIVYKGPVLIVMPNGLGFYHGMSDPQEQYAALRQIRTGSGNQLAQAAIDSVATLARNAGHPVAPRTIAVTSSSGTSTLLRIGLAVLAALVVAAAAAAFYGRRSRRS